MLIIFYLDGLRGIESKENPYLTADHANFILLLRHDSEAFSDNSDNSKNFEA